MNCSLGLLTTKILRSATGGELLFKVMTSSDEDDKKVSHLVDRAASLPIASHSLSGSDEEKTGLESSKLAKGSRQEAIQHFRPQAGTTSLANAVRLPDKIMAILLSEEAPDAIWWLQKGSAFAMQKEKFQQKVLDKHFRGNKFKSLVRNLHRWGFKRMTCDTSAAGKTIAFSHKHFRQDKPELVQLVQITKEKDIGDANVRRQALHGALPSTSPPNALRMSDPSVGPLREEGLRMMQDGSGFMGPRQALQLPVQQPSLANLVATEHDHNLSHGPDSLLTSLTSEWHPSNQEQQSQHAQLHAAMTTVSGRTQLQDLMAGRPRTFGHLRDNTQLLTRLAVRAGTEQDQLDQMRPSVYDAQRMQRFGSLFQAEGESLGNALQSTVLQQFRRDALLQQHLMAARLGSSAEAHGHFLLQQHLTGRPGGGMAAANTNSALFHPASASVLPRPNAGLSYLPQLTGSGGDRVTGPELGALQQGGWTLEQLLARRGAASLQQQGSGRSMDSSQRSAQQDAVAGLTSEELRYLAELRRRTGS